MKRNHKIQQPSITLQPAPVSGQSDPEFNKGDCATCVTSCVFWVPH